ncbi:MAG: thioredoxin family protein [Planctomycetota bacterium]|jgi:thioredoxin-related protein|nr:thioredoxin family protein [Planctomycetota bacterium]MDP6940678.1 thioredoxin family protein [Planctomycetota bacterium]
MKNPLLLLAGLVLATPVFAQEDSHADWFDDFDKAAAAAKAEGKDLLVDFTGSDWCGWCIKLHEEVFQHAEFLTPAKKDYILVALDFPRDEAIKAKVPNPERNDELNKKYGIRGFPTILLMNTEGEVFGRTGYQEGGPEKYIAHMAEIADAGRKGLADAKKLNEEFKSAEKTADQKTVVLKAIDLLEGSNPDTPGTSTIADIVRKGFDLGLETEALKALLGNGHFDDELGKKGKELDAENKEGLLELVILAQCRSVNSLEAVEAAVEAIIMLDGHGIKDREVTRELYVNAAFWCNRFTNDLKNAKKFANKAKLLAGDDQQLHEMLDGILNNKSE